jgi:hypothetical protein
MLPGGLAALMRPTSDPDVLAVVGQRIWSDGERTWLSPLYDIPDIRQPGRKSIATHPGLMYYAALAGKVFHRSLFGDLRFEGRVMGDQPWTIRALLRADGHIEVVGETVFEWRRPHPDRFVETITSVARASATGSVEMAKVAVKIFGEVSVEVDAQVDDPATRLAIKKAYFERLLRSDLGGAVRKALDRRDPATGQYFDALTAFLQSIPTAILTTSDALLTDVLRPPIWHWTSLVPPARPSYWRMADLVLRLDRGKARRIAGYRVIELAFVLQRLRSPIGPAAASAYLTVVSLATRVLARRPRR